MKAILAIPAVFARKMVNRLFEMDEIHAEMLANRRQAQLMKADALLGGDPIYEEMMAQQARAQLLMVMGRTH